MSILTDDPTALGRDRPSGSTTRIGVTRPPGGGRVRVTSRCISAPDEPVIRPMLLSSSDDTAQISLVPEGALLLAGDAVSIDITVGAGAGLDLIEPAGTVAYAMFGGSASWNVSIRLEPRARLTWAGEPFVVAEGARVERSTRIELAWDSVLALRETLVLGRHGERPGTLEQYLDVTGPNGLPMLSESLSVGPDSSPLVLGGARTIGSVLLAGRRLADASCDGTILQCEAAATMVRRLSRDAHSAQSPRAWAAAIEASLEPQVVRRAASEVAN